MAGGGEWGAPALGGVPGSRPGRPSPRHMPGAGVGAFLPRVNGAFPAASVWAGPGAGPAVYGRSLSVEQ